MNPNRKKRHEKGLLTIGEIAKEFGILSSQVRYYTRLGLLNEASRTRSRYRLYKKDETIKTLGEVLRLKREGVSLGEIKMRLTGEGEPVEIKIPKELISKEALDLFKAYPIKFAYLFGSYARNDVGPMSDIDIALYLDDETDEHKRFDIRLELIGEVGRLLKTEKLDLIILNDVDIALAYRVIYDGKIIYCKDELKRIRFEARTMSQYFDQQYYYRRHAKMTISRIAKEGIL